MIGPARCPLPRAEFQAYDSILSTTWAHLAPSSLQMITSSVRDLGSGLVMIGGEQQLWPGAYRGTPIEEVLPVDMEVRKRKVMPTGAVAMVLHTCEFPDGNQIARETAAPVVDALGEHDKVGILLYDGQNRWGLPLQEARDKDRIKEPDLRPRTLRHAGLPGIPQPGLHRPEEHRRRRETCDRHLRRRSASAGTRTAQGDGGRADHGEHGRGVPA